MTDYSDSASRTDGDRCLERAEDGGVKLAWGLEKICRSRNVYLLMLGWVQLTYSSLSC